jgi:hypothetical protein
MEPDERPRFLAGFFEALAASAHVRGAWAIVPYKLLACLAAGLGAAYYLPIEFFSDDKWEVSAAVFGGLLTFNALIIAVSWSAFSKVFEIIASNSFGAYLKARGLLHRYLIMIDFMNIVQIGAALISAAALLLVIVNLGVTFLDRGVAALCIASTMYSLSQAWSATQMMADLIWHKATFDRNQNSAATVLRMEDRGASRG